MEDPILDMLESTKIRHGENGPLVTAIMTDVMSLMEVLTNSLRYLAKVDPDHAEAFHDKHKEAIVGFTGITCAVLQLAFPDMTEAEMKDFLKTCSAIHHKTNEA